MDSFHELPFKVYGLVDPRDHVLFYVGMSYTVKSRVVAHNTDKNGAAYTRCQEIIADGYKPAYCILGVFTDEFAAVALENALITVLPDIANRTHKDERKEFWRKFPQVLGGKPRVRVKMWKV